MTNEPTIWKQTLDLLRENGWKQGSSHANKTPMRGCMCVGEAIAVVTVGNPSVLYSPAVIPANLITYLGMFAMHVAAEKRPFHTAVSAVFRWNDTPGRTDTEVFTALEELDQREQAKAVYKRQTEAENTPRMPSNILPYETDANGETAYCQICGEPADDEMGEFSLPQPDPNGGTEDQRSVIAHAQCGLDHNLEIA